MSSQPRVTAPRGHSGNPIRDSALALVPQTLDAYIAMTRALWTQGPLSPAEIEMVRLRNARRVNCVVCKSVRYELAREAGLDENKIQRIDDDHQQHAELSEREKLLLAFTDQYFDAPAQMSQALTDKLQREFSEAELLHLSLALAFFNGFSRCAVALGGMPDQMPLMAMSLPQ